jgi:hypothetical protein
MMVLLLFLLAAVFFIVALTTVDRLLEFKEEADARSAEDEDKDAKDNIIKLRCQIKQAFACALRGGSFLSAMMRVPCAAADVMRVCFIVNYAE